MADSALFPQGEENVAGVTQTLHDEIFKKSILIKDGNPAHYHLQHMTDNLDQSKPYRKISFGERVKNKPHKTILLVGETGTGKTKLINVMVNYMLGVQREDKVWFIITDDQSNESSAHSQTSSITVYGVYLQESPMDLTIIDTPGYGGIGRVQNDTDITMRILSLSGCDEWICEIDAVCLVIDATQNRLSDRQIYVFDAVQSLFGKDITENIVLLFTHSTGSQPKNALTAVKEAKIKCAVNEQKNQPVFFLFDNVQGETFDEEYQTIQEKAWSRSYKGMTGLFKFLDTLKPKSLKMTQDVWTTWKQLEAMISYLQTQVHEMKLKQGELTQTQEALEELSKDFGNKNITYEHEETYKEKVPINTEFWHLTKAATCCTVCEENCHYPGCWWASDVSWCSVMRDNHCTVCTKKCHYSKHVKEAKIYVTKTKKEKRTDEHLKKGYEDGIMEHMSSVKKLEKELQGLEKEKMKRVMDAFHFVETLQRITYNADSLIMLLNIDFMIEMAKEINELKKAKTLEEIKKKAAE